MRLKKGDFIYGETGETSFYFVDGDVNIGSRLRAMPAFVLRNEGQSCYDIALKVLERPATVTLSLYHGNVFIKYWQSTFSAIIALDEMYSSATLSSLVFYFAMSQFELVRVSRETSRHRHRRHPSRWDLAQSECLRAGYRYYSWSY